MDPVTFYKCLADETRLRCLMLIIQEQELCVCELTTALAEIQPKISRHLAHLRKAALLIDRREAKWVFYRINPALPQWAKQVLEKTTASNQSLIKDNLDHLNAMGDRPARARLCC